MLYWKRHAFAPCQLKSRVKLLTISSLVRASLCCSVQTGQEAPLAGSLLLFPSVSGSSEQGLQAAGSRWCPLVADHCTVKNVGFFTLQALQPLCDLESLVTWGVWESYPQRPDISPESFLPATEFRSFSSLAPYIFLVFFSLNSTSSRHLPTYTALFIPTVATLKLSICFFLSH